MRSILLGLILVAGLMMGTHAKAGILIEPYLGYGLTSVQTELTTGGGYKFSMNAPALGARLGYQALMFWVAADYMTMSGTAKVTETPPNTTYPDNSMTTTSLGAVAGLRVPMLRAYVGYMFMNNAIEKVTNGENKYSGTAVKGGLSFTGFPIIALNLEYIQSTFTKYESGGVQVDIGGPLTTLSKATANTVLVSVSAPFNF